MLTVLLSKIGSLIISKENKSYLILVFLFMPNIFDLKMLYEQIDATISGSNDYHTGHINIFNLEDLHLPKNRKPNYARRNFYKITLITGQNRIHYADQYKDINGTALVFTNPNIHYFWEIMNEKQSGYMCIFTEPFFTRFGNIKDYPAFQSVDFAVLLLDETEAEIYYNLFSKMYEDLHSDYAYKYDLLNHRLMEIIHEAQKKHSSSKAFITSANAAQRLTDNFKSLLESQFPIDFNYQIISINSASAFAKQLNVHTNHLNKVLISITGRTTTQWIHERILQEAKVLLKTTNWTVAEIAYSLGYNEPNQFSAFFKSKMNVNATKFRKSFND